MSAEVSLAELDQQFAKVCEDYWRLKYPKDIRENGIQIVTLRSLMKKALFEGDTTMDQLKDRCMCLGVYVPSRFTELDNFFQDLKRVKPDRVVVVTGFKETGRSFQRYILEGQVPICLDSPVIEGWERSEEVIYLNTTEGPKALHIPTLMISPDFPKFGKSFVEARRAKILIRFGTREDDFSNLFTVPREFARTAILYGDMVNILELNESNSYLGRFLNIDYIKGNTG